MNILLLGPNGQLGGDVSDRIKGAFGSDSLMTLGRESLDVQDLESLRHTLGQFEFDVLINCTSVHKTDDIELASDAAFNVNVHAVRVMSECAASQSAKFFHVSTDYVFGALANSSPIVEDAPTAPLNVYGASKALGESLARAQGSNVYILRVASLFGVRGASGKGGNFVETMIRLASERDSLSVVDDQIMSPTNTADAADMIVGLIRESAPPGIYHLVNSGEASWYQLASKALELIGAAAKVEPCSSSDFPSKAVRPSYSVLSNDKIAAVCGRPDHWELALSRYLRHKGHIT